MKLSITVVIPVKNAEPHLKTLFSALEKQTIKPNEIIFIDNLSSDGTVEIIKKHIDRLKSLNIKLLTQKKLGPSAARNLGIKEAKSDIIAFTDADCIPSKDWISNIIHFFKKNTDVCGVNGVTLGYKPSTLIQKLKALEREKISAANEGYIKNKFEIVYDKFLDTANSAIKKSILENNNFDEDFTIGEDIELTLRLYKTCPKIFTNNHQIINWHKDRKNIINYFKTILKYRINYCKVIKKHFSKSITIMLPKQKTIYIPTNIPITTLITPMPFIVLIAFPILILFPLISSILIIAYILSTSLKIQKNNIVNNFHEAISITLLILIQKTISIIGKIIGSIKYKLICL